MRGFKNVTYYLRRILAFDAQLSHALGQWSRRSHVRKVARLLSHSADSWVWLIGFLGVGLLDPALRCSAWIGWGIVFSLAVFIYVLKILIRRQRPRPESGWIYLLTDGHSFPSGHAARVMLLVVLSIPIGQPVLVLGLVLWAVLVALSRLVLGVHFVSDVLVGMILGGGWGGVALALYPGMHSICEAWGF